MEPYIKDIISEITYQSELTPHLLFIQVFKNKILEY